MPGVSFIMGVRRLWAARDGQVAVIFAAILVPIIGIVATAIDLGRAAKVRSTLQTATSAAAEAASARLLEDRSIVEDEVRSLLKANLPPHLAGVPHSIVIAGDRSSIEVRMETTVPTTLMGVVGVDQLAVEATGFARPAPTSAAGIALAGGKGGLHRAGPLSARGGAGSPDRHVGQPGASGAPGPGRNEEAEKAARAVAAELERQLRNANVKLPPGAAADIERLLRDMQRMPR